MKKILVVDDDKNDQYLLRIFIGKHFDCEVISAYNGLEALEKIELEHPEIVLLDIAMPVMSGVEMMETMAKKNWRYKPPIIAISANCERESVNTLFNLGAIDFLPKPIDRNLLQKTLEMIWIKV